MKKSNSDQLKRIMRDKGLSPADVAQIMNCSIWTVYRWRSDCDMPAHRLEMLQLKLAMRAAPGVEAAHV